MMKGPCTRLSAVALGIAFGIVSALFMALLAWGVMWNNTTSPIIDQWATIYQGYSATWHGGLIGAVWGFVEGFICGLLAGWIYNLCICCCSRRCGCGSSACPVCNERKV